MKKILSVIIILFLNVCYGAIYMHVDKNGTTVYSDTPESADASVVNIPKSMQIESSGVPLPSQSVLPSLQSDKNADTDGYTIFTILSPKNNENVQNQVTVPVSIEIKPALRKGDKLQLFLDNKPIGDPVTQTTLMLPWVERGEHQLSVAVIDKDSKVIKNTDSITIFIHRVTTNSPARQQSTSNTTEMKGIMATVTN